MRRWFFALISRQATALGLATVAVGACGTAGPELPKLLSGTYRASDTNPKSAHEYHYYDWQSLWTAVDTCAPDCCRSFSWVSGTWPFLALDRDHYYFVLTRTAMHSSCDKGIGTVDKYRVRVRRDGDSFRMTSFDVDGSWEELDGPAGGYRHFQRCGKAIEEWGRGACGGYPADAKRPADRRGAPDLSTAGPFQPRR